MSFLLFLRRPRYSISVLVFGLGAGSMAVHPHGRLKNPAPARSAILATADAGPEVRAIIQRSCVNCHSNETAWPWYSYVAPMSWLIEDDVFTARARMNLSQWDQYSLGGQEQLLAGVAALVRNHKMPPPRYTLLHSEARLSDAEAQVLYRWAQAERRRVKKALRARPG